MNKNNIARNLKHLGLSNNEIKVYISLTELGESNLVNIAKKGGLARTTTKSIIERLVENGYISTVKYNNINNYWIEPLDNLKEKYETKINLVDELNFHLKDLYRSSSSLPFSQVYDTKDSIRKFIEKTVTSMKKNTEILTIDTPKNKKYETFLSKEYLDELVSLKKKKGIVTKILIPSGEFDYIRTETLEKQDVIIREMDKRIQFESSLWIIEDRLILFSSQIPFIVEVKNHIIVNSIKSILNFVWELSTEVYNKK